MNSLHCCQRKSPAGDDVSQEKTWLRRAKGVGGLIFPGDEEPDYWDFFYYSLVVAMTAQVSDVQITSKVIRRAVSVHGVLSFFFNLTVLALTVNMLSNLI